MYTLQAIGTIHNERKTIQDDYWGDVISEIKLGEEWNESSLDGVETFSHLEIIYVFHLVQDDSIQHAARHPRNNPSFPKVGIFAQRGKNRPNKLGATIVELVSREGKSVFVKGLDAIDGTPVVDIKPVMEEFLPKTKTKQPEWATDIMSRYWE
ncbi:SAM-dependent methyltransferase [Paenibacillus sp. FSL H8-0457]|uniref:SAM-dependent methyltransferase n=1 Tax=unclassified Paenibacillus TaxID=185978 RepID=UPI0003E25A1D|nr:SAM-dependent methyltransferase [Paenibacillus sp. FSL H8-457]ETT59891.1 hypothetical protein C172_23693 [Paenibacillus sp. FSL H8-457]